MTRGTVSYIGQRLVLIAITTVLVSSIVFLLLHQIPGNAFLNETRTSPEALAANLHHYGLDLPLPQQYLNWFTGVVLHGDLGESLKNRGVYITPLLVREASVSATVGFYALLVTIGLGLILGIIAALRQNTWVDYVASSASVVGYSIPSFVIAIFGLLLAGHYFYVWTGGTFYYIPGWGKLEQVPVPALALGIPYASYVARLTRASMLETIRTDYVRTAWAKGLKARVVVLRHALRNALIPVTTMAGVHLGNLLGGAVVVETVFGWPGMGRLALEAVLGRDFNLLLGVLLLSSLLVIAANAGVDLLQAWLDPRIQET
jgi:ABC-type dipeptide/oligopeptide/nickel transport system permease component